MNDETAERADSRPDSGHGSGLELRLCLLIGPSAQNLQALRWELLVDPVTKRTLATSERTLVLEAPLTPERLLARLREQDIDVLYLVCHGLI